MANAALKSDYPFTDHDFKRIAMIAYEKFGLYLEPCKKPLVYSRLARRLRLLGLGDFAEYCDLMDSAIGEDELREMLSALTTNVTQFFRESHHFEQLRQDILPDLLNRAKKGGRLRFWSAGCSAGQEAYSLALTLRQLCPDAERYDIKILATDIDPVILQSAVRARYTSSERSAIPDKVRDTCTVLQGDQFVIDDATRKLVSFGELNLIQPWPMKGYFDVILCRNVAIYFDDTTRDRLWKRFAEKLVPDGYLMIGHSERLSGAALSDLKSSGVTSYQKK